MSDNTMPKASEITGHTDYDKARKRGESHGFTGSFLDNFIERELVMMVKWRATERWKPITQTQSTE